MPTIQIDLFPGRTIDQKRSLVDLVTKAVTEALGVRSDAVRIKLVELEKHHSARGGVLASDLVTGPLLGILGGMGPLATADFYVKLIRHTPATRDQDHLRVVIWADPTVPDRTTGGPATYPVLLRGACRLRAAGATLAAMPCNTAHVFLPRLLADSGLRFLDMVAETVATLDGRARSVGLLATSGTVDARLYHEECARAGIRVRTPTGDMQREVQAAIAHVKAGRPMAAGAPLLRAARHLADGGVDAVILACTELPVAVAACGGDGFPDVVDPTEVLATAAVRECLGLPRAPPRSRQPC